MLRLETETGWWLVTHQDHARLAGRFAEHWGNELFASPEPRRPVLLGIATHDDGWAARDARPQITRAGLPAAFSVELVGKYSAFEEIDLADYIAVREQAVAVVAAQDAYAGLLVSLHTDNLLTPRAPTVRPLSPRSCRCWTRFLTASVPCRMSCTRGCGRSTRRKKLQRPALTATSACCKRRIISPCWPAWTTGRRQRCSIRCRLTTAARCRSGWNRAGKGASV